MVKRKVDNRVRTIIENGVATGHRTLFVVVGDKSKDQVVYLHHMLSKTSLKQATVLWCYKNKLALSSHRKKRMKQLKAKQQFGCNTDVNEDDPFEMFVSMTDIRYCYYKETHKILGNTFKMCVLQDFEALTPNILCRTIETVEGGGVIVLLLESLTSLKQLYTLNMDVHSRYRTESHAHVVPRFNERFILSLASCRTCIVMNDELKILPISSLTKEVEAIPFSHSELSSKKDRELKDLKEEDKDLKPTGALVGLCKTSDQVKVVRELLSAITAKTLCSTVALTAARGRGKSAAMGLALAGAISVGYANMFVTSPSPENLKTLFTFLLTGLEALGYEKHLHYQTLISSDPDHNKAFVRLTVYRDHRQIVQYISPTEADAVDNAELVVIDEAAAIPLPRVKALLGPHLVFLSSTVSGYEGTGRALSLNLIKQLRVESTLGQEEGGCPGASKKPKRKLVELSMSESIRYEDGDHVEAWLYDLLCLESFLPSVKQMLSKSPQECQLYYVNRDTLFGYHKLSEKFLKSVMSLLVSSHYRNTPDDLQMLSDAPAHHLFVLLPTDHHPSAGGLPPVLCVIQVALEGKISKADFESTGASKRPSGDMIPWTVSNLFQDRDFPRLSGARVVRIATHPDLQGRGFGCRALELLEEYYATSSWKASTEEVVIPEHQPTVDSVDEESVGLLDETVAPRGQTHPLLLSLPEREAEALHYLGVSFGASPPLVRFWKKVGFSCVYVSQTENTLTGEHSCLFLKVLNESSIKKSDSWLRSLWLDYRKRMMFLLPGAFRHFETSFALGLIVNKVYDASSEDARTLPLHQYLLQKSDCLERLEAFSQHQCDFSSVVDLMAPVALLYFLNKIPEMKLKALEIAMLLGVGVQRKHPSTVAEELSVETPTFMNKFHSLVRKIHGHLLKMVNCGEKAAAADGSGGFPGAKSDAVDDESLKNIADQVDAEVAAEMVSGANKNRKNEASIENVIDLSQYVIRGKEEESVDKTPLRPQTRRSDKRKKLLLASDSNDNDNDDEVDGRRAMDEKRSKKKKKKKERR